MKSLSFSIALFFPLVFLANHTVAGEFRVVALSDQLPPGTSNGEMFDYLSHTAINNMGEVAFLGYLEAGVEGDANYFGRRAAWKEEGGVLSMVVRAGDHAPGSPPDAVFATFNSISLNDDGEIFFRGNLLHDVGGITVQTREGLWRENNGALELITGEWIQAPGAPAGLFFSQIGTLYTLRPNSQGQVSINGNLNPGSFSGIWSEGSGTFKNIALTGSQVPDMEPGVVFNGFGFAEINDSGQSIFKGRFYDGNNSTGGLWLAEPDSTLRLVASEGTQAPGVPQGTLFKDISSFVGDGLNNIGQVVFTSTLQTDNGGGVVENGSGVWLETNGALELLVQEGDLALDTNGAVFGNLEGRDVVIDNTGRALINTNLETGVGGVTTDDDQGIWAGNSDGLYPVAREGSPAPGTPSGVTFGSWFGMFGPNSLGQAAFLGELALGAGGVTEDNNRGLWAEDINHNLHLIIRRGDVIEVAPGDSRVLDRFGGTVSFNDLGQFAFTAKFTDGSSAVLVSNKVAIPEPATCIQALLATILLSMRRKRTT